MNFPIWFVRLSESRRLCEAPYKKTVDWGKWHIFWADERVVAKSHAESNYKLAKDGLLSKVFSSNQYVLICKISCS